MKKRISILTLALLFFASTTGLPLVLHYCEMMESVSLEICEMHKQSSCCGEESNANVYITSGYDPCCSTKLVDSSVKDNFVISKIEQTQKNLLPVILIINQTDIYSFASFNKFYNDTSPPLLTDNHLYLTNSILLI